MYALMRQYLGVALLRVSPADLPMGTAAVCVAVLFALATYVFVGSFESSASVSMSRSLLDLSLNAVLLALTLMFFGKSARFTQAYSAMCGSGAFVNLAALPLMWRLSLLPDGVEPGAGFLLPWLLLMGWLVAIQAHILRLTLETTRTLSIVIAVVYLIIAFEAFDLVFGGSQ